MFSRSAAIGLRSTSFRPSGLPRSLQKGRPTRTAASALLPCCPGDGAEAAMLLRPFAFPFHGPRSMSAGRAPARDRSGSLETTVGATSLIASEYSPGIAIDCARRLSVAGPPRAAATPLSIEMSSLRPVLRNRQRLQRTNAFSLSLSYVTTNRGFRRADAEHAGAGPAHAHVDALLERSAVDRMTEIDVDDGLLERRIGGVLVELGAGDLRCECRRSESSKAPARKLDLRRQCATVELATGIRCRRASPVSARIPASRRSTNAMCRRCRATRADPLRDLLADQRDGCG